MSQTPRSSKKKKKKKIETKEEIWRDVEAIYLVSFGLFCDIEILIYPYLYFKKTKGIKIFFQCFS